MMLVVDNLHPSFTASHLRDLFAPFGKIVWSRLVVDTNDQTRAFGYVELASETEADHAVQALDGTRVLKQLVRVMRSTDSIQRRMH